MTKVEGKQSMIIMIANNVHHMGEKLEEFGFLFLSVINFFTFLVNNT